MSELITYCYNEGPFFPGKKKIKSCNCYEGKIPYWLVLSTKLTQAKIAGKEVRESETQH